MTNSRTKQLVPPSEDDNLSTLKSSSQDLRYPQLLLESSFESLLATSYPSNPSSSATMAGPEHRPASLSESWASISDAEFSTDDDLQSENTDHGSLIDTHSAGDMMSVRDDELSSQAGQADEDAEDDEDQQDSAIKLHVHTPISGSIIDTDLSEGELTLEEDTAPLLGEDTATSKATKTFSQGELRKWKLDAGGDVVGKIVMPVGTRFIKDTGRQIFQVLLFSRRTATDFDDAILHKLADAQLASMSDEQPGSISSPSKYHVVPDTFGPGSQPSAAAVVPVDYQLETFHYETASIATDALRTITLGDRDNLNRTVSQYDTTVLGSTYTIQGAQIQNPDLALVLIDDLRVAKNRDFARASLAFARRHNISAIAMRNEDECLSDPILGGFIREGLHLTVQSTPESGDTVNRVLLIHRDMFLRLNPGQLSRHIYQLMRLHKKVTPPQALIAPVGEKAQFDIEKHAQDPPTMILPEKQKPDLKMIVKVMAVCLMLLLFVIHLLHTPARTKWTVANSDYVANDQPQDLIAEPRPDTFASSIASMLSTTQFKSVALATAEPSLSPAEHIQASNRKFEVEAVGNSHLVVRSVREYRNLEISVMRQGKTLQSDTRVLFPGVWSVRLDAEQAYGNVCVQLLTKRPSINETVSVNLGQQSLDAWFKALLDETEGKIQQKLALLQDSLESIQRQEHPQQLMETARTRLFEAVDYANRIWQSPEWRNQMLYFHQTTQQYKNDMSKNMNHHASQLSDLLQGISRTGIAQGQSVARRLSNKMHEAWNAFDNLHLADHWHNIWERVQEGPRSDTLATAQERAQQVVKELRDRFSKRGI